MSPNFVDSEGGKSLDRRGSEEKAKSIVSHALRRTKDSRME